MTEPDETLFDLDDVDDLLAQLIEQEGGSPHSDLIAEILRTTLKLVRDRTSRGDLKIINTTMKEMRYAMKVFRGHRRTRKVSLFGSARTEPSDPVYQHAVTLARRLVDEGFMVITGAGPGIMQAGNEGAGRESSFGVNIRLPFEQEANEFIRGDPKLINFKYFFTRKLVFVKESDAIVLFPGGFGTHDEGFESLTLVQTGKTEPMPLVFIDASGGDYWKEWEDYVREHLLGRGLISEEDMGLFHITESVDDAVDQILRFYHVYNSSRYVRGRLVLRLNHELTDAALAQLNEDFGDIVASGSIRKTPPLAAEANEPETSHLPRLLFHFNRHHYGRLRQLIDRINDAELIADPRDESRRPEGDWFPTTITGD